MGRGCISGGWCERGGRDSRRVTWRWAVSSWCRGTGAGLGRWCQWGFEGGGCSPGQTTGRDVAVVAVRGRSRLPLVARRGAVAVKGPTRRPAW